MSHFPTPAKLWYMSHTTARKLQFTGVSSALCTLQHDTWIVSTPIPTIWNQVNSIELYLSSLSSFFLSLSLSLSLFFFFFFFFFFFCDNGSFSLSLASLMLTVHSCLYWNLTVDLLMLSFLKSFYRVFQKWWLIIYKWKINIKTSSKSQVKFGLQINRSRHWIPPPHWLTLYTLLFTFISDDLQYMDMKLGLKLVSPVSEDWLAGTGLNSPHEWVHT